VIEDTTIQITQVKGTAMKTMKFTLPEHLTHTQALGYACGLSDGIFAGWLPVVACGPTSTNDPEQFNKVFGEWHDLGKAFGEHSKGALRRALNTIPQQWWWPVCIAFAGQHLGLEENKELTDLDRHIEQGMKEFGRIYQEYLL
jgi:hypothetical protein